MPEQLSVPGGLSVAIIAKNEAHRIEACLQSVAFADQIVVLDSGSTDDTVAIARRLGAEVEETDWPGFGPQKNRALARCRHRWVLSLDADERLSPALAEEILRVLHRHDESAFDPTTCRGGSDSVDNPPSGIGEQTDHVAASDGVAASSAASAAAGIGTAHAASAGLTNAEAKVCADACGGAGVVHNGVAHEKRAVVGYWLRRSSTFCGQEIRYGLWGNDRVLRLFERERGRFSDDRVHERLICEGKTRRLDEVLLHDSVDSLEDALNKSISYSWLGAEKLRARGHGGVLKAWLHGSWSFVRGYLLRAGFLDGRHGLTLAWLHARGTFWKYRWAALPEGEWEARRRFVR
ncbi:MAG: glycosyltransferase family 2 protein [Lautropia sp.]|nr:glycosyltransferase family 2 protein [Lautropia sp.]